MSWQFRGLSIRCSWDLANQQFKAIWSCQLSPQTFKKKMTNKTSAVRLGWSFKVVCSSKWPMLAIQLASVVSFETNHYSDRNLDIWNLDSDLMSQNTSVVTQKLSRMGKRRSNSGSRYVVKAETLTSKDANLRENLHSLKHRWDEIHPLPFLPINFCGFRPSSMDSECTEMDEQKKRKLERMRNLRKIEDISNFKVKIDDEKTQFI